MKWHIKFRVLDKIAREKHLKSVLSDINVTVPTELTPYIFTAIKDEVYRLRGK